MLEDIYPSVAATRGHVGYYMLSMSRIGVVMCGILAALLMAATYASNACAVQFVWRVERRTLGVRETRRLGAIRLISSNLKIKGTDARGTQYEVVCTVLVQQPGSTPEIFGGTPGTISIPLQFEGCSVATPAGCRVRGNEIRTQAGLEGGIVEGVGRSRGLVLLVMFERNLNFATIEIEGCGVEARNVITGTVLAEAVNPPEELQIQRFKFEPAEFLNYRQFRHPCVTAAGLAQRGANGFNQVTLAGEFSAKINPEEAFGPF